VSRLDEESVARQNRVMPRLLLVLCAVIVASVASAQVPTTTPTPGILESISLKPLDKPAEKTISVGQFANLTATGIYDNGVTKNLTPKLTYTSSDPTVAVATNSTAAGESKSRIEAVQVGVVTISAEDPVSGISTLDAGGVSFTLTVQGALVSIALKPSDKNAAVGDTVTYTATGMLSDGNTRNLTQKVVYASSDTSVAVCPNTAGNKSQVQAVGVGTATISATDPETEITTAAAGSGTLTVRVPSATATGRTPTPTPRATPALCGDPDATGTVTVTDGVLVLSAAADLPSECSLAICDVDGSGTVTVTDGVLVLRNAAGLDSGLSCN
jgi:hypothetical protein